MRIAVLILFLLTGFSKVSPAQTTNYQAYGLFVINIAKYSSWPDADAELRITVLGKSKVYEELMKQNGKNINGRVLKVIQTDDETQIVNTHVLYLPDGKSGALNGVIQKTEGKSVLIIGEREGLFKKGAGFSFVVLDNSALRFDINSKELEKRQIKISKSLSTLANSAI